MSVYYRIQTVNNFVNKKCWTIYNLLRISLYQLKFGNKNVFWGKLLISIKPNSKLLVGKNCIFFSSIKSNLIGINRPCSLSTHDLNSQIIIGNNCGFSGTVIASFEKIEIGNNVLCGANTTITDSDWHGILPNRRNKEFAQSAPVIIKDDVWLGLNVTVLKGVTIGENSVIAANSNVVKDIPANSIAGGNPCKVISQIK